MKNKLRIFSWFSNTVSYDTAIHPVNYEKTVVETCNGWYWGAVLASDGDKRTSFTAHKIMLFFVLFISR